MKFSDSFLMSDNAGSSTLNGDAGVGFSRVWTNCDASIASASTEEFLDM